MNEGLTLLIRKSIIVRKPITRWAARYVTKRYHNTSSVTSMLNHLNCNTLENRRNINRVTMLYKITHNLVAIDPNLYLVKQPSCTPGILTFYSTNFSTLEQIISSSVISHTQLSYGILCHMQHSWHPLWTNLQMRKM